MSDIKTRELIELQPVDGVMTTTIQDALNSVKKVVLKAGVFMTGPLVVPSNTTLCFEKGSVLKFIDDFEAFPPVFTRWEGVKCWCMHPCLWVNNAENVTIEGEGTLDGSGQSWWVEARAKRLRDELRPTRPIERRLEALNPDYLEQPGGGGGRQTQFLRPPLLQIKNCKNVVVEGIFITNSPFWTVHPLFTENLTLRNLRIENPYDAPNTDGIDIESCKNVTVENCDVYVGDDGIALKSGSGIDGIRDGIPAEYVTIKGCTVKAAHGGAVIGSETAGGINNIYVEDCIFDGTDRGVRIKTRRTRGGLIHDLYFKNCTMKDNLCPFVINMYYRCGADNDLHLFSLDPCPVGEDTPEVYSVHLDSCTATGSLSSAGMIVGLPEKPIYDLSVVNCSFAVNNASDRRIDESDMYLGLPDPPSRGFRIRNAEAKLENLEVLCDGEKIIIEDNVKLV